MQKLYQQARKVAPMNIPVLITGESGTGKDVMARYIHHNSDRHDKPYIAINCSALPFNLIESELFGYEKGAFTGADKTYKGLFMSAQEGTLFLDEIGDMPLETQAKLLRVLETGEFHRIGSSASFITSARVITATNKNLADQISRSLFREDLFYRLNVITLHIPPLRERREDIPSFAGFFVDEFCQKNSLPGKTFTKQAMEYLKSLQYKGNIRELKNLCIKLAILTEGKIIDRSDFEPVFAKIQQDGLSALLSSETLKEFKAESERLFLMHKLKENEYNISRTADSINTPRSNLYKKIEAYGIEIKSQNNL
jgi:two-component system nitrogen regulation response regulator NtrX